MTKTRKSHRRSGKGNLNINTVRSAGRVMVRFDSTAALRIMILSPLAINNSTSSRALGYYSTRLNAMADCFFEYRFTKIKLHFRKNDGTLGVNTEVVGFENTIGTVADPGSQFQTMDCSWSHIVNDFEVLFPQTMSIPVTYLRPTLTRWLKCTVAADDNLEFQGTLYTYVNAPAVDSYRNEFEVEYVIEFRNPIFIGATPRIIPVPRSDINDELKVSTNRRPVVPHEVMSVVPLSDDDDDADSSAPVVVPQRRTKTIVASLPGSKKL